MATPRKEQIDFDTPGFYHCTNRCVRRAFLCGLDKKSGNNYDHRKKFLEERIRSLCKIFAVEVFAYAIMSNHYHIVLYIDPRAPRTWSDEEVAEKWLKVYPSQLDRPENSQQKAMKQKRIINSPELLEKYRERLGSISWFMRRLNEPMAKMSNKEDDCTGKFWEGRFSSQALLDEAAVLSCMAYVDLNPVRAKIAEKLEQSEYTSIKKRLEQIKSSENQSNLKEPIKSIEGSLCKKALSISLKEYIQIVEWAGKHMASPDKATMPSHVSSILENLNLQSNHWLSQVSKIETGFGFVVGPIDRIRARAEALSKKFLKGISSARELYISH